MQQVRTTTNGRWAVAVDSSPGAWSQVQRVGQRRAPEPSPFEVREWMVYAEGGEVVGPVTASQIARGIRAGRVPDHASVQRAGEVFWTGLLDEPVVVAALQALI